MNYNRGKKQKPTAPQTPNPVLTSLLDTMIDGREYQSLHEHRFAGSGINVVNEIKRSIAEISAIRKRPAICFIANVIKPIGFNIFIDDGDDKPFEEMIANVPSDIKDIDIILVTPGGSGPAIKKFVDVLRPRFDNVGFIILYKAMSAGTIFAMSGNEIIMSRTSQLGPTDPQQRQRDGNFLPLQGVLHEFDEIKKRIDEGAKSGKLDVSDQILLQSMNLKEVGFARNQTQYSVDLVKNYLYNYKFRDWDSHRTHNPGTEVTDDEKMKRAEDVAMQLCDHKYWKDHGHAINREDAYSVCQLEITHSETIDGLDRAMRRMWALFCWTFENVNVAKVFVSADYSVIKHFVQPEKQKT
ncbi:SDH family Clp fold serine proteinase [Flavobacterium sp.]